MDTCAFVHQKSMSVTLRTFQLHIKLNTQIKEQLRSPEVLCLETQGSEFESRLCNNFFLFFFLSFLLLPQFPSSFSLISLFLPPSFSSSFLPFLPQSSLSSFLHLLGSSKCEKINEEIRCNYLNLKKKNSKSASNFSNRHLVGEG